MVGVVEEGGVVDVGSVVVSEVSRTKVSLKVALLRAVSSSSYINICLFKWWIQKQKQKHSPKMERGQIPKS